MDQFATEILGKKYTSAIDLLKENLIEINYSTSIDYECDGYVQHVDVSITEIDENDKMVEIGEVKINILRNLGLLSTWEAWEHCDCISQHFVDGFSNIFGVDDEMDMDNSKKLNIRSFNQYVYIKEFRINENHRSYGLGSAVIKEIINFIDKGDLFALIPFAIEDRDNEKSHKRIEKFWKRLGFKRFNKSGFFIYSNLNIKNK